MASSSSTSATTKGLKAFGTIADNPSKLPHGQLANRVSAILAPDAVSAMQKRSASIKPTQDDKHHAAPTKRSSGGSTGSAGSGRRSTRTKSALGGIDVHNPTYTEDIKTTHDMANEVTNILGANVLGALKASCNERKQQQEEQQESDGDGEVEDEEEEEADQQPRKGRIRAQNRRRTKSPPRAKTGDVHMNHSCSHHHGGRKGGGKKKMPIGQRRSKSFDNDHFAAGSPKRPSANNPPSRKKNNNSRESLRHKHEQDFANHAEDVGIDLDDDMPCDLDEIDNYSDEEDQEQSEGRQMGQSSRMGSSRMGSSSGRRIRGGHPSRPHPNHHGAAPKPARRARKPTSRRSNSTGGTVGGAAPGRRGRNGRRGGGTRLGDVKREQVAIMTSVDQTKQFREEDLIVIDDEPEEQVPEYSEARSESSSEDGLLDVMADATAATANLVVKGVGAAVDVTGKGVGAVVDVTGKGVGAVVDVTTDAAEMATSLATTAGGAVLDGGGVVFGALGTAVTYTANTASSAAAFTANTVAAGATDAAAAMSLRSGHARSSRSSSRDEYSDDSDDDEPPIMPVAAGEATWGFTGGGLAPQINTKTK